MLAKANFLILQVIFGLSLRAEAASVKLSLDWPEPFGEGVRVFVSLEDREHFLKKAPLKFEVLDIQPGSLSIDLVLADIEAGTYAISAFMDTNGNGLLDTNLVGVPTEPYGFSQNARKAFGAPSFNDAKFDLGSQELLAMAITLIKHPLSGPSPSKPAFSEKSHQKDLRPSRL